MTIVQWLIFRGVGHAQTGTNEIVSVLPIVACGRTSWPGIYRYSAARPKHVCRDCEAALGHTSSAPAREAVIARRNTEPPTPSQGSLF